MNRTKRNFIIRTTAMSLLIASLAISYYLYHYVLAFNAKVTGKIYAESIFKGGRYEVKTLKYYYEYDGHIYFDKQDEVVINELEVGDSLAIRVLRFFPKKHIIAEVHRNYNEHYAYDPEDGFETQYHMHIEAFEDYYGPSTKAHHSKSDKLFYYSAQDVTPYDVQLGEVLDKIKFNQGSLVESSIIRHNPDSILLYQIYYYLNNYSLDSYPPLVIKNELKSLFPNKKIQVSVLDKSNPKHERIVLD